MTQFKAGQVSPRSQSVSAGSGFAVVGVFLLLTSIFPLPAGAQQARRTASSLVPFAVASVKPSQPGERMTLWPMGDADAVIMKNVSIKYLVEFGYNLEDFQLSGGPEWLDSQKFDIDLKRTQSSNSRHQQQTGDLQQQRRKLIQSLLEDRFKLKMNVEAQPTPSYTLLIADGGPRFTERRPVTPDAMVSIRVLAEKGRLTMSPGSNQELAKAHSGQLGCEVIDRTGRSGVYDIALHWTPDSQASLVAAVLEQLGLRLEEHIKPVRVYSIDDVQKPPIE